jgi:hypothetical protein
MWRGDPPLRVSRKLAHALLTSNISSVLAAVRAQNQVICKHGCCSPLTKVACGLCSHALRYKYDLARFFIAKYGQGSAISLAQVKFFCW